MKTEMKSIVVCLYVFCMFNFVICINNSSPMAIKFLRDFILKQNVPVKVMAALCHDEVSILGFIKTISDKNYQLSVQRITNTSQFIKSESLKVFQLFILDATCKGFEKILLKAEANQLFQAPFRWLVLKNNSIDDKFFQDFDILLDSQFYVANCESFGYTLKAAYKNYLKEPLMFTEIALWEEGSGFGYFHNLLVSRNRTNLNGIQLNVSMVITDKDSLNHLTDYRNPDIDIVTKTNYLYILHIFETLNITGNILSQNIWGFQNKTTLLFNGIFGDIQRGIAEFGGTPAFIIQDRFSLVDFVPETVPDRIGFVFREPSLSYVSNIFILSLSPSVWISCFILLVVSSILLYLISKWEWKTDYFVSNKNIYVSWLRANFYDTIMVQLGGICQQGSETEPRSLSGRITLLFSFIFLMFVYTSYSATIVALLQSSSDNVNTLKDLLNSRFEFGAQDASYNRYYFPLQKEPIRKTIYEQKIAPKGEAAHFLDVRSGVEKMRTEFYAFHAQISAAYKIMSETFSEHEKCGIKIIPYLQNIRPWMFIKKNSSFKELIKVGFRKLHERGIQKRETNRLYPNKPTCHGTGNIFRSVGLIDTYFCLLIFSVGVMCSITFFILEILLSHHKKKKLNVTNNYLREIHLKATARIKKSDFYNYRKQ